MTTTGATDRVRQELAALPVDVDAHVELGSLLRAAGTLAHRSGGWTLELLTTTGAVARRAHHLVRALGGEPVILVREATNVERRAYGVVLDPGLTRQVGSETGLLRDGSPTEAAPVEHEAHGAALIRGALLGGGSVSAPRRDPHLEIRASRRAAADQLGRVVGELTGTTPSTGDVKGAYRVVLKSRAAIHALLEALGASAAAEAHGEQRGRRQLRADAQRLANADAANLRRAVEAAVDQVTIVERAIELAGWAALGDDLREVALARLANPAASLSELGALCDPPVGKSAVSRRLGRLRAMVEDHPEG